ncbi:hypothetical protein AYJ54_39090 [Bradyrhizobium centrolobii]|uniref:DUF4405 domain-containing protein n=1 Tax=Bradyrhizobium centrolobii TaxID=1505087 RepID=A0A176Z832_9BRAD|nr:hypothetical protein [Bradyrhizobium centrolobii]OAF15876.1 hypothetical protein AYJ54_39090 [Bradyrhizobium centrolobii]
MRLGFWQKIAVFSTVTTVGISGLFWWLLHDVVGEEWSDSARILLTVHGISSYALLVVVGSLLPLHVRSGWRRGRNIATGVLVTATIVILSATALVLYYGGEEAQTAARWVHLAIGFGCMASFPAHAFLKTRADDSEVQLTIGEDKSRLTTQSDEQSETLSLENPG